jgi:hypothetical protein
VREIMEYWKNSKGRSKAISLKEILKAINLCQLWPGKREGEHKFTNINVFFFFFFLFFSGTGV